MQDAVFVSRGGWGGGNLGTIWNAIGAQMSLVLMTGLSLALFHVTRGHTNHVRGCLHSGPLSLGPSLLLPGPLHASRPRFTSCSTEPGG